MALASVTFVMTSIIVTSSVVVEGPRPVIEREAQVRASLNHPNIAHQIALRRPAAALFALPTQSIVIFPDAEYDVAPDGRFLFNVPVEKTSPTAVVTLNWKAGIKK